MLLRELVLSEDVDNEDPGENELYQMFMKHKDKMTPEQVALLLKLFDKYEAAIENNSHDIAREAYGDIDDALCQFELGDDANSEECEVTQMFPTADGGIG